MPVLSPLPRERLSRAGSSSVATEVRVDAPSEMERRRAGDADASRAAIERDTRSLIEESAEPSEVSPNDAPCRSLRAASPLAAAGTASPVRRARRSAKFCAASAPGPVRGEVDDEAANDPTEDAEPERDEGRVLAGAFAEALGDC